LLPKFLLPFLEITGIRIFIVPVGTRSGYKMVEGGGHSRIAGSDFPKGTLRSPQDQGKPVMGGGPVHGGKVHFSQPIVKLLEPVPTQQSNGRNIQGAGKGQAHGDGTAVLSVKVLGVVPV